MTSKIIHLAITLTGAFAVKPGVEAGLQARAVIDDEHPNPTAFLEVGDGTKHKKVIHPHEQGPHIHHKQHITHHTHRYQEHVRTGSSALQKGDDDLCVSISHSKEVALAAFCTRGKRVGVDVEKIDRNISEQVIRQVYNTEDLKGLDRLDVWLVKEAVFKASNGLISHLSSVVIVKQINDSLYRAFAGGLSFMVCTRSIEGSYRVSVAVEFSERKFL